MHSAITSEIKSQVEKTLGQEIRKTSPASKSANSNVFKIKTTENKLFALKIYPKLTAANSHPRQETETHAIKFFQYTKLKNTPEIIAENKQFGFTIFQWLEGNSVEDITNSDLENALEFLWSIFNHSKSLTYPGYFNEAKQACLSSEDIFQQIDNRLSLLEECPDQPLANFLSDIILPLRKIVTQEFDNKHQALYPELVKSKYLPPSNRRLIPSDFGFHNSIRMDDGSLTFIDFEYFGWDDPVKVILDWILHPGQSIQQQQKKFILEYFVARKEHFDEEFAARLDLYYPLILMRWSLIMLNLFLPENQEKLMLKYSSIQIENLKMQQLKKTNTYIQRHRDF